MRVIENGERKTTLKNQICGVYPLISTKDLLTNLKLSEVKPLCFGICSPIFCAPVSGCGTVCSPLREPF